MDWWTSSTGDLAVVALKVVVIYSVALVALRIGERRTLAQWTIIDFAAAVAVGAIIGRTAVAEDQPVAAGAVALIVLVLVHRLASLLRFSDVLNRVTDHRIRVLVVDGRVRTLQLRMCGLTDNDLAAELRQRDVFDLSEVRYVLYETKGGLTVVPWAAAPPHGLVDEGLDSATQFSREDTPGKRSDPSS